MSENHAENFLKEGLKEMNYRIYIALFLCLFFLGWQIFLYNFNSYNIFVYAFTYANGFFLLTEAPLWMNLAIASARTQVVLNSTELLKNFTNEFNNQVFENNTENN